METETLNRCSLEEVSAARTELMEEAHRIAKRADGGSELTKAEQDRFEELTSDGGLVDQVTDVWQEKADFKRKADRIAQGLEEASAWNVTSGGPVNHESEIGNVPQSRRPKQFSLQDANGNWHRAHAANSRLAAPPKKDAPTAGELLAFWATSDERHLQGKNPMAATTGHSGGASGGFLIPNQIAADVIDRARAQMVTGRAGTQSMVLAGPETRIVKVASDPSGQFVRELGAITASSPTFEQIILRPYKYSMLVPISREAIEDAYGLSQTLQSTAEATIASAVDQAVLQGSGTNEPRGILNQQGVNKIESVGTPTSYSDVLKSVRLVYDANFAGDVEELAWIHSPREWETYAGLVATGSGADGQPLQVPPKIADLPNYTTSAIRTDQGAGDDESSMIVGDFTASLVGYREGGGVIVEFLDGGAAIDADGTTLDAVRNDMQWMRFTIRFDVAVLRPDHFTILSGVTAGV